jgi:hypothetical protein
MLADDAVRHEEAEPRASLFGREVGLEEAMAKVVRNA